MSPITHFLSGWVIANCAKLDRRDRSLVTLACVIPDIDGIGIIPELLTRNSAHPLLWFTHYHHSLHSLVFAVVVAVVAFVLASKKWETAALSLLTFHVHLLEDVLGSRGPDGYQWPIAYLKPFSSTLQLTLPGQWGPELLAKHRRHRSAVVHHSRIGMAPWVLAPRNDFHEGRLCIHRGPSQAFPATVDL
jgi:inner membrane protein